MSKAKRIVSFHEEYGVGLRVRTHWFEKRGSQSRCVACEYRIHPYANIGHKMEYIVVSEDNYDPSDYQDRQFVNSFQELPSEEEMLDGALWVEENPSEESIQENFKKIFPNYEY